MATDTFSLFFALLALAALAGAVVTFALLFLPKAGPAGPLVAEIGRLALPMAWLVTTVTTLGSLYYSEVAGYTPCELCWYQRIAVYPLPLVLGIAIVRRDPGVRPYVIGPALVGVAIAAYHSWIQAFPPDSGTTFCTVDAPCTTRHVWELGFVSLPFMAFCAFACTTALMLAVGRTAAEQEPDLTIERTPTEALR